MFFYEEDEKQKIFSNNVSTYTGCKIIGIFEIEQLMLGKNHFLSQENVLLKNFAEYSEKITASICENAEKLAKEVGQSVTYLYSPNISKEGTALEIIKKEKLSPI